MSSFIPNSYQTPNALVDVLMPYLSASEWRVLSYATRHILGFQERIASRTHTISVSTFENGYGGFPGCGESRETIIAALNELDKYRVMVKVGKPTKDGQKWKLNYDQDIDLNGLKGRHENKRVENLQKVQKAQQAKQAKRSDTQTAEPAVEAVCQTDRERSDTQTDSGLTDRLNQTHFQTHSQTHISAPDGTEQQGSADSVTPVTPQAPPAIQEKSDDQGQPDTPPVVPPAAERPRDLVFDAIKAGWKLETGSFVAKIKKLLTGTFTPSGDRKKDRTNERWIENNITPPMDADEIKRFVAWYDDTTEGCALPEDPEKICKWVQKGRAIDYAIESDEPQAPPLQFLRPPSLPLVAPIVPPAPEDMAPDDEDDYITGDDLARAREMFQAVTARMTGGEPEHA